MIDVVHELADYDICADVPGPQADPAEARHEYGLELTAHPEAGSYDGIVLAVAHRQFRDLGTRHPRSGQVRTRVVRPQVRA